MKPNALALVSLLALGGAAAAQVPAPDFWIDVPILQPSFALLELGVQGPPNATATLYLAPEDPSTVPSPRRFLPFATIQLDALGEGSLAWPLQGQGPLPDVALLALVRSPGRPVMRSSIVRLGGALAFALLPDSSCVIDYTRDTGRLDVRVNTTPHTTVSIWEVDCDQAPFVGFPFNTLAPGVSYVGGGNSDASGGFSWSGVEPGARCLVVVANGVALGVSRRR